ncbi:MAG: aldolase/citrate lyase family protein, partial [Pseudomonadota bacterium]
MPITDLKDHFTSGGTAVNGWCAIPSPITAEILGRAGFDMVTVDLQHGLIDYQMALTMCQVLQGLPAPVLCRVPWNEPGIIMKCLDAGFTGLICPMINTKEDARRLVEAARYAPLGGRSFGPTRANMVHGAAYARNANKKVLVLAMIETREALSNLDAILGVDGIDGVYVGPSDLGLSLGYEPTLEPTEAAVIEAIAEIASGTRAAGLIAGVHTGSPTMIKAMFE